VLLAKGFLNIQFDMRNCRSFIRPTPKRQSYGRAEAYKQCTKDEQCNANTSTAEPTSIPGSGGDGQFAHLDDVITPVSSGAQR